MFTTMTLATATNSSRGQREWSNFVKFLETKRGDLKARSFTLEERQMFAHIPQPTSATEAPSSRVVFPSQSDFLVSALARWL